MDTTSEQKYKLAYAKQLADKIVEMLRPHCERIEIAGSIRRECKYVKDIEIVAIPKPYQSGMFEDGIAAVVNKWAKVKGEMEYGKTKYTQRILPEGIKLDLFFAVPENWGLIFAIRTGSADYSHYCLAANWVRMGYHSVNGFLTKNGVKCIVREEKDLFYRLNMEYVEPKERNWKT